MGINHIAFWAPSKSVVERFYKEYLVPKKIPTLYGGPKEYEYRKGYYAVYFEDPDRLKLELVAAPSFTLSYKGVRRVNLPKH